MDAQTTDRCLKITQLQILERGWHVVNGLSEGCGRGRFLGMQKSPQICRGACGNYFAWKCDPQIFKMKWVLYRKNLYCVKNRLQISTAESGLGFKLTLLMFTLEHQGTGVQKFPNFYNLRPLKMSHELHAPSTRINENKQIWHKVLLMNNTAYFPKLIYILWWNLSYRVKQASYFNQAKWLPKPVFYLEPIFRTK
jgi:hypothetical protein